MEPPVLLMTEETHELIRQEFICSERGEEEVKGFGTRRVFTLDGELDSH